MTIHLLDCLYTDARRELNNGLNEHIHPSTPLRHYSRQETGSCLGEGHCLRISLY